METTERICAHDVKFNYHSNSKYAVPDDSEVEHVKRLIADDDCVEGELCLNTVINGREREFRGWWTIQ